jgi:uncharacterized membrane protein
MTFVLWASLVVHIVSSVVWVGGLVYINAVLAPIAEYERQTRSGIVLGAQRRYFALIWSSLWPMLLTGILLMLLNPRFRWWDLSTTWSQLLVLKEVFFLLMAFFSWQLKQVFGQLESLDAAAAERFDGWWLAYRKLVRRSIVCGLAAVACAAGMRIA